MGCLLWWFWRKLITIRWHCAVYVSIELYNIAYSWGTKIAWTLQQIPHNFPSQANHSVLIIRTMEKVAPRHWECIEYCWQICTRDLKQHFYSWKQRNTSVLIEMYYFPLGYTDVIRTVMYPMCLNSMPKCNMKCKLHTVIHQGIG